MTLNTDQHRTIKDRSEGLYKEKGSKFISIAVPVTSLDEVHKTLANLRKSFHDARHHCYAYRLGHTGEIYRMNDDGEPSGTAGKPIYNQLLSFELTNVLVVVIRYFGGTKLGTSGLIRAYKSATQEALNGAKIAVRTLTTRMEIHFPYTLMNDIMRLINEESVNIDKQEFTDRCMITISVPRSKTEDVAEKFKAIYPARVIQRKSNDQM